MERFICMTCGKLFKDNMPMFSSGTDGCCSAGSLIEVRKENDIIGNWLILGEHIFDTSNGRCEEFTPTIE